VLANRNIAVVIPAYRVTKQISSVLATIPSYVDQIFVIDDSCPDGSGKEASKSKDKRVKVLTHEKNLGVGGAVKTGYEAALKAGADVVVKVDGDGQMDPSLISELVAPIVEGKADYTKGNRFDTLEGLKEMPKIRIFGNAVLSFMAKISTGYWAVTDPTNGFTAIHKTALSGLQLSKISNDFFFESDMLFRLSVGRAVVLDFSMPASYGDEKSNLRIWKTLRDFPYKHFRNFTKRIFYSYYLRELNIASIELPAGILLFGFGVYFGLTRWAEAAALGTPATAGTVMLSAVPLILGFQLILAFLAYDIGAVPTRVRQKH
jgi:dolichol-phosphate mannosyltransferase